MSRTIREALTLSDRVMVMEGGRIRQIDTPENLLRRPADAYVREFVGENLLRRQKALGSFSGRRRTHEKAPRRP